MFSLNQKLIKTYYYIDASILGELLFKCINILSKIKFVQIKFKMMDIKDENGELIRLRISRKDLLDIQTKIVESNEFLSLIDKIWFKKPVYQYLRKSVIAGTISGSILDPGSAGRALYIINIIYWFSKKLESKEIFLILNRRPWFDILEEYSMQFGINLIAGPAQYN